MELVDVEDVESPIGDGGVVRSTLSEPLGTTGVALNRYRIPPGEGLPAGLHAHRDQEEVFLVTEGVATFDVLAGSDRNVEREDRTVTVSEGEAIRFTPGEFQSGRNDGARELVILAMGAPRDSEEVWIPADCPSCGHAGVRVDGGGELLTFVCPECGTERVPTDCPACGHPDLRIRLAEEGGTETACKGCGETFDRPPLRDR